MSDPYDDADRKTMSELYDEIERLNERIAELEDDVEKAKALIGDIDGTMAAWLILSAALAKGERHE